MDMRLELVPLPTSDVERSKALYLAQVGTHTSATPTQTRGHCRRSSAHFLTVTSSQSFYSRR